MNFSRIKIFGILISVIIVFAGCFPKMVNTSSNNKKVIRKENNPFIYKMHSEFAINRLSSGNIRLYIKLNLQEFMFARLKKSKELKGKVMLKYFIYKPDELQNIVDSADFSFDLKKQKGQNNAITYLPIKDVGLSEFYLKVITIDLLRRRGEQDFIYVNFDKENSRNNFFIQQKSNGAPYFRPYFRANQLFNIKYYKSVDSIFIKRFKNHSVIPAKPYMIEASLDLDLQHDTVFGVSGESKFEFSKTEKALYCLQVDTSNNTGLYLLNAGEDFPYVRKSEEMVLPLQYLCKTSEFKDLKNSSNKKLAVDRFWLKAGGNANRSRELIRIFYNRVLYANVYFTSYAEGWKTDRGMIYLLFGTPKFVKKQANKETWIYSDRYNQKVLQFVFNRKLSPYSDNVFVLERSADFQKFWREAVKSWRSGKVYTVFRTY